jgi:hypothetical protein
MRRRVSRQSPQVPLWKRTARAWPEKRVVAQAVTGKWVAQLRRHLVHARPAEVDHDLTGNVGYQFFHFIRFESFTPADHAVIAPRHTGSMRIGAVAGIERGPIRADVFRAYKDHTHGFGFG